MKTTKEKYASMSFFSLKKNQHKQRKSQLRSVLQFNLN